MKLSEKKANRVWVKLFGFKVGDKVRIKAVSRIPDRVFGNVSGSFPGNRSTENIASGQTGIIIEIYKPNETVYPYVILFDNARIQMKAFHVYKEEELEPG